MEDKVAKKVAKVETLRKSKILGMWSSGLLGALKNPLAKVYEKKLERDVRSKKIPGHVAIIMDGNRRFARRRGLPPKLGHVFGSRKAEDVLNWCWELGIKNVTVYAFSTENFNRSEEEKKNIFDLVAGEFRRLSKDRRIHRNRVKVRVVGRTELLPDYVVREIVKVEEATKNYGRYRLNVALAYGGRQEIIDAVRAILREVKEGKISSRDIDERTLEKYLYGEEGYSRVDLLIRTGGEQRLSNFLTWQTANSVACFLDVYWPEFRKIDLLRAIRLWQSLVEI